MDSNNLNNQNNYQDNTQNMMSYQPPAGDEDDNRINGLQVAGLVCGILGIVSSCCYAIGLIFGIIGLVCAIFGNKKSKNGLGLAALICSIVGTLFGLIFLVYYIRAFGTLYEITDGFRNLDELYRYYGIY